MFHQHCPVYEFIDKICLNLISCDWFDYSMVEELEFGKGGSAFASDLKDQLCPSGTLGADLIKTGILEQTVQVSFLGVID